MWRILHGGFLFAFISINAFETEKFLKDHCEVFNTVYCSFFKFSEADHNDIQATNFIISNASYFSFKHCSVVVNGAFFEKFPNAFHFEFENCEIDFMVNTIRTIPEHKALKYLDIWSSSLKDGYTNHPYPNGLSSLTSLEEFKVYSTKLNGDINMGFFRQVPQIKTILFKYCNLRPYSATFEGLNALETLVIEGNVAGLVLFDDLFKDLKKLKMLWLESNGINIILPNILPPSLESLFLKNNSLRLVTQNMFSQLAHLKYLDLSFNGIELLSENAFDNQTKLERLFLQDNKIKTFTRRNLNGTRNLIEIRLSNNVIEHFSSNMFDDLKSLQWFSY